jgi:hypothetical protein
MGEPKTKRTYRRNKPHNKVSPRMLKELNILMGTALPRYRIAKMLGISRGHLYHLIDQYQLEGATSDDSSKSTPG